MTNKIPTHKLIETYKRLVLLSKRNMMASGVHISIAELDSTEIGDFEFNGSLLPELIPIMLESLTDTLVLRRILMQQEMRDITELLKKEED